MADVKITALAPIGANPVNPATFPIPMVDLLDNSMAASGTTKKVTVNQILGAGGTATLASATITGDLTVRTNKLAVTSTGVGCGVATPLVPLHAETAATGTTAFSNVVSTFRSQAAGRDATLQFSDGTNQALISMLSGALSFGTAGSNTRYNIDATGISTWSVGGSTAMTLNSTGLLVGTTSANGSASNSVKNVGGVFSTVNGATGSIATGVAATLFTAPSEAVFIVSAYIVGSASPANYNAVAIVRVSGGTAAITTISTASNLTISLSGLNVQATQTSGINQSFAYSAIRIS
jgi:hypothetical protein